jgi:hypothetical protein
VEGQVLLFCCACWWLPALIIRSSSASSTRRRVTSPCTVWTTPQTYYDAKLVAGLPDILGSGVTACNAKTCFVAPLSPSTGPVVFSIDLATKAGYSYFYHYGHFLLSKVY